MNTQEAFDFIAKKVHTTKIVQNEFLDSVIPSLSQTKAEVYFIRDDGWMIGTPREFAKATYELWKDKYIYYFDTQIPDMILPLTKS